MQNVLKQLILSFVLLTFAAPVPVAIYYSSSANPSNTVHGQRDCDRGLCDFVRTGSDDMSLLTFAPDQMHYIRDNILTAVFP